MTTSPKSLLQALLALLLVLALNASPVLAASATWLASPATGDWNTATNWAGSVVPNATTDTATFDLSNITAVSVSTNIQLDGITFNAGATAFTVTAAPSFTLTLDGAGVTNDSGRDQNFVTAAGPSGSVGKIVFSHSAKAGNATITNHGGMATGTGGGVTNFTNSSTADHATIINNGGVVSGDYGGGTKFHDSSTAGHGSFVVNGWALSGAGSGYISFHDGAAAGSGTFVTNGGIVSGISGGIITFLDTSTADSGTFTNNGGTVSGAYGGAMYFNDRSSAGRGVFVSHGGSVGDAGGCVISFSNTATAGSGTFTNNGGTASGASGSSVTFSLAATAGNGVFATNGGTVAGAGGASLYFYGSATAGSGIFTANGSAVAGAGGSTIQFYNDSTAGSGTFVNHSATVSGAHDGQVEFLDNSNAGSASFTNQGSAIVGAEAGGTFFFGASSAGSGVFANRGGSGGAGGLTTFSNTATAGSGTFTIDGATTGNGTGGVLMFDDDSTAGNGVFVTNGATTSGYYNAGQIEFYGKSSAGSGNFTINGGTVAGAYGGVVYFRSTSSAGASTLIAHGGTNTGSAGSIVFEGDSVGATATVKLFETASLDLSSHSTPGVSIGSIEGTGTVLLGARNLTLGSNGLSTIFSGVAQGTGGSITKTGGGTLTLAGPNTYTGGTTISAGTLLATNASGSALGAGPVAVASGATFGGDGFVSGLTTVASGGHLAPGNSTGTLTFTGGLTLATGAILDFQIGTSGDRIDVTGGTLTVSSSAGGLTLNLANSGGFVPGVPYTLLSFVSGQTSGLAVTDFSLGKLAGVTVASDYTLSLTATSLVVTYNGDASAIPDSVAPTITSSASVGFTVGEATSFAIKTTGRPASTFSAIGLPSWANLDATTGVLSGTPPSAVGAPFAATITANNGTLPAASQTLTLSVAKGVSAITWVPRVASLTYGMALSADQLNAGANAPGTFTYTPAAGALLNAGVGQILTAVFTPADPLSYTSASASSVVTVSKAPLTAKVVDTSKVQGTANPKFAIIYTGFANGDTEAVLDTIPVASTNATAASAVGTYPIVLTGGVDNNYTLTLQNGTLTVDAFTEAPTFTSAKSATFTIGQAGGFTVDATGTPAPTFSATGLPTWASLNPATGVLSGTPVGSASSYEILLTASNGTTPDATQLFTLTVATATAAPALTTQPANQTVATGGSANFTVVATGTPAPNYQWQLSSDDGANWADVANGGFYGGWTTTTLSITGVSPAMSGYLYRCVATNTLGSATSISAQLTVRQFTLAGTYFGTFSNNHGRWALKVNSDNTATYIAYLTARNTAVVTHLTINSDGTFTTTGTETGPLSAGASARALSVGTSTDARVTAVASAFTLTGQIIAGAVTGQLTGLGETFTGTLDSNSGSAPSGYYTASALNTAAGSTYAIVAPSGQTLVVVASTTIDSASGTVGANGQLAATTSTGAQLALTLNASAQSLAATLTPAGSTTSIAFAGLADGIASTSHLVNIATRAFCSTDNKVTIGGFVVAGPASKRVLIRAVGPSLTAQGIGAAEALADPVIEVHAVAQNNAVIATNDNWADNPNAADLTATASTVGATALLGSDTKSAALLTTLTPGVYSFVVTGKAASSGIVLLEVYDADATPTGSTFTNIATRAQAATGNGVTIGGFVISGDAPKRVLLRAVGPTLSKQGLGVAEVLADPVIELHDAAHGNATIATVDNVADNPNAADLLTTAARIGATPLDAADTKSAALLLTLQPGVYSFIASGKNSTTGIVLVEIYDAD